MDFIIGFPITHRVMTRCGWL